MKKLSMLLIVVLFVSLLCFSTTTLAKTTYGNLKEFDVVSVYDGDTIKVNIPGWPRIIGEKISIRVKGIDTPELRKKQTKALALKARALTRKILKNAKVIELRNIERGKYFRIVAEIYVDGKNLADILIKEGLGKPYQGGKRPKW